MAQPKQSNRPIGCGSPLWAESLQKTRMCRHFARGNCKWDRCNFAHHASELRQRPDLTATKMCPTLINAGQCTNPDCNFAHNQAEFRGRVAFSAGAAEAHNHKLLSHSQLPQAVPSTSVAASENPAIDMQQQQFMSQGQRSVAEGTVVGLTESTSVTPSCWDSAKARPEEPPSHALSQLISRWPMQQSAESQFGGARNIEHVTTGAAGHGNSEDTEHDLIPKSTLEDDSSLEPAYVQMQSTHPCRSDILASDLRTPGELMSATRLNNQLIRLAL